MIDFVKKKKKDIGADKLMEIARWAGGTLHEMEEK